MEYLLNLLDLLYFSTPERLRIIYRPVHILRNMRIQLWALKGLESNSKQELAILFAGKEANINYFVKLVYGQDGTVSYLGKTWFFQIPKIAERKKDIYSMFISDIPIILLRNVKNSFQIPCWVDAKVDISKDLNLMIKKNKSLRSQLQNIGKYALNFEVTKEESRLRDFYYNMHLPYIMKRYPNSSMIDKYETIKKTLPNSELLVIKSGDKEIAGGRIGYKGQKAYFLSLGVKDAETNYVKIGALGALYYFTLQYLKDKGFQKVDLGLSRPFLTDPVLTYKKRWGIKIADSSQEYFLIKQLKETDAAKAFLVTNPFIYIDKRQLNCAVFINENTSIDQNMLEDIPKHYNYDGIDKINIFSFGREAPTLLLEIAENNNSAP